jgi:hypothetical protein
MIVGRSSASSERATSRDHMVTAGQKLSAISAPRVDESGLKKNRLSLSSSLSFRSSGDSWRVLLMCTGASGLPLGSSETWWPGTELNDSWFPVFSNLLIPRRTERTDFVGELCAVFPSNLARRSLADADVRSTEYGQEFRKRTTEFPRKAATRWSSDSAPLPLSTLP